MGQYELDADDNQPVRLVRPRGAVLRRLRRRQHPPRLLQRLSRRSLAVVDKTGRISHPGKIPQIVRVIKLKLSSLQSSVIRRAPDLVNLLATSARACLHHSRNLGPTS